MIVTLVLLFAAMAAVMVQMAPRQQPVRARRNPLQEELLAAYAERTRR